MQYFILFTTFHSKPYSKCIRQLFMLAHLGGPSLSSQIYFLSSATLKSTQDMLIGSIPMVGDISQNRLVYLTRMNDGIPSHSHPDRMSLATFPSLFWSCHISSCVYVHRKDWSLVEDFITDERYGKGKQIPNY